MAGGDELQRQGDARRSYHQGGCERRARFLQAPQAGKAGFFPTSDFAFLRNCDAILICVPTPLTANREPDLSSVTGTAQTIAKHLRRGELWWAKSCVDTYLKGHLQRMIEQSCIGTAHDIEAEPFAGGGVNRGLGILKPAERDGRGSPGVES